MNKSIYIFLATISLANATLTVTEENSGSNKVPNTLPRPNATAINHGDNNNYPRMWTPQKPVKYTKQAQIDFWTDLVRQNPLEYRITDTGSSWTPWIFK